MKQVMEMLHNQNTKTKMLSLKSFLDSIPRNTQRLTEAKNHLSPGIEYLN